MRQRILLLALATIGSPIAVGLEPVADGTAGMRARLERDDAEIRQLFVDASTPGVDDEALRREALRLREVISRQMREAAGLRTTAATILVDKLYRFQMRLDDFERFLSSRSPEARQDLRPTREPRLGSPTPAAAPTNDACSSAIPIVAGQTVGGTLIAATHDGSASCGLSALAADLWYSFTTPASGPIYFDLFGSSYDTVLSVHTGCPGFGGVEIKCDDDTVGTASAVGFLAHPDETYWIRVSGFGGAVGAFALHAGIGGTVEGDVTAASGGTPLSGGHVIVRKLGETFGGAVGSTDGAGHYEIAGLPPGPYSVRCGNFEGFLEELHSEVPCTDGHCSDGGATPVEVGSFASTTVDFALEVGSAIRGRITATLGGGPLEGAEVSVLASDGFLLESVLSDALGDYEVLGLAEGSYFVVVSAPGYATEAYNGVLCLGAAPSYCVEIPGSTPIAVVEGADTTGIDVALNRLGAISGLVTDSVTGDPIADAFLTVEGPSGTVYGGSDGTGAYEVGGLFAGDYVVRAGAASYRAEIYDDVPCEAYGCTGGVPIVVSLDATQTGIDFALTHLGAIAGRVTDESTGLPIVDVRVELSPATNPRDPRGAVYTADDGTYVIPDVLAGSWVVHTTSPWLDEVYDDIACLPTSHSQGCGISTFSPVTVALAATTTGIDFSLAKSGQVSGSVSEARTGDPLSGWVYFHDSSGQVVATPYAFEGEYSLMDVLPGTYYVRTEVSDHVGQLYSALPCEPDCDPTVGTPVMVTAGATMTGIDFSLRRRGVLKVNVVDMLTGAPVDAFVSAFGGLYSYSTHATEASQGISAIAAAYSVRAVDFSGDHYGSAFAGSLCAPSVSCDGQKGTPVTVEPERTTSIVIPLLPTTATGIVGRVRSQGGAPLGGVLVDLWSDAGQLLDTRTTFGSGEFLFAGLAAGSYRLSTRDAAAHGYGDRVWPDAACSGACDPLAGDPIAVGASLPSALASGIQLSLPGVPLFVDGFESGDVTAWSSVSP